MLVHEYSYYIWKISGAALFTIWGIIALILLILALYWFSAHKSRYGTIAIAVGLLSFTVGIYAAEYDVPESPDQQRQIFNDSEWQSCGVAVAKPIAGGQGMSNPCEWGCFRGATLRKTMSMGEFPPWPRFQREVECWRRIGPWAPPQAAKKQSAKPDAAAASH
jgi:hypothetical protein